MRKKDKNEPNKTFKDKLAENCVANLIAILAVVISIFSWMSSCESNKISHEANKLSSEANKISHEAVKIAKTAELPYFKFSKNYDNGRDEILIHNEGGMLRELENPVVYYFWSITSDKSLQDSKEIAVINYYNLGSRDPLLSSKTPVTISAENSAKAETLIDGLKKLAKENNFLLFLSAEWYVRLQYKDIYDDFHDDMYDVSPIGSRKMLKNEAEVLIKKYNQKIAQGMAIDISTATPEILYKKWQG